MLKLVKLKVSSQQRIAERINPESLVQSFVLARYRAILDQREEILAAFVAKYGCEPDEAMQVVRRVGRDDEIFYVLPKIQFKNLKDSNFRLSKDQQARVAAQGVGKYAKD